MLAKCTHRCAKAENGTWAIWALLECSLNLWAPTSSRIHEDRPLLQAPHCRSQLSNTGLWSKQWSGRFLCLIRSLLNQPPLRILSICAFEHLCKLLRRVWWSIEVTCPPVDWIPHCCEPQEQQQTWQQWQCECWGQQVACYQVPSCPVAAGINAMLAVSAAWLSSSALYKIYRKGQSKVLS